MTHDDLNPGAGLIADPRHVPSNYQGKLEPNAYCRAWQPHVSAYCTVPAGEGTDHPGTGRCQSHDGRPVEHGMYSRYSNVPATIRDIYDAHAGAEAGDPLNVLPEIQLMRALLEDYVGRYTETRRQLDVWYQWYLDRSEGKPPPDVEPLLGPEMAYKWLERIIKAAHAERKLRMSNAISLDELTRLMASMGRVVKHFILEEDMAPEERLKGIREEWGKLQVPGMS